MCALLHRDKHRLAVRRLLANEEMLYRPQAATRNHHHHNKCAVQCAQRTVL